jgi:transposase
MQRVQQGWAGIDVGKGHHHVVLVDADGKQLVSRRVANDEAELRTVIELVLGKAVKVTWAVDLDDTPPRW